jgi:hypothetical protein
MSGLLVGILLMLTQEDALKTLADPARRADPAARKAAQGAFAAKAADPAAQAAAAFLARSEAEWKLPGDPLAPVLDAYFKEYWTGASLDEAKHRKALEMLGQALEKAPKSQAREALVPFLLLHASPLGDKASDVISRLGFAKEGERWGRKDDLLCGALAKAAGRGGTLSGEAERSARGSTSFAVRYALLLFDLFRIFNAGQGFERAHKALTLPPPPGSPPKAADHYKALAESLKAAVYCRACKDGRTTCPTCQGRKRGDFPCPVCHTIGWMQKPGSPAGTLVKCTRCAGPGVFRNANCPPCKATGLVDCVVCAGKPWRDGFKGCRDCRICESCKGQKRIETPCGACNAKGRVGPFVAGIPTTLCTACTGNAATSAGCATCKESGLAPCAPCGGAVTRDGRAKAKLADVFTTAPCAPCGGTGFPLPNLAVPCPRCLGQGLLVLPASAPDRQLP